MTLSKVFDKIDISHLDDGGIKNLLTKADDAKLKELSKFADELSDVEIEKLGKIDDELGRRVRKVSEGVSKADRRWIYKKGGNKMTKNELKIKLINDQVPEEAYSLEGGRPNEVYCLNYINGKWETYYSERGIKSDKEEFATEDDACNYFYKWLIESLKSVGII